MAFILVYNWFYSVAIAIAVAVVPYGIDVFVVVVAVIVAALPYNISAFVIVAAVPYEFFLVVIIISVVDYYVSS